MKVARLDAAVAAAVFVFALTIPLAALGNPYVVEREIVGFVPGSYTLLSPDIGGGRIVYAHEPQSGSRTLPVFNLALGRVTSTISAGAFDAVAPAISGDWVVFGANADVLSKNLKTGASRVVTSDGIAKWDGGSKVSTADGAWAVWYRQDAGQYDIMGKNLATNDAPFMVYGGAFNQTLPAIYGKRVAFLDNRTGVDTVWVKTIGSSAAPVHITDDGHSQSSVDIGDHLIAWLATAAGGQQGIRYCDYNTGLYYDGPSSTQHDMSDPQVSGDRILFSYGDVGSRTMFCYDTRLAKAHPTEASVPIAATGNDDRAGRLEGNQITYLSGNLVYHGRLVVPTISLNAVPSRIPHGGHIHLKGSISEMGIRLGAAVLGIERYGSGKWTRIKTLTTNSQGEFSYKSPAATTKTKYRVVYDGFLDHSGPQSANHLSTVSSAKTAWPR